VSDNTNFLSIGDQRGEMYSRLNEKSELERFRNQFEQHELDEMVEQHRHLWEPAFRYNHKSRQPVPLHPWKVLKMERRAYAEIENDGSWPDMQKRHALRVVKDEYVEKWRSLAGLE